MVRYWSQKIFSLFFSLFMVMTLTFFFMKALPGDPFLQEQNIPQEIMQSLRAHYGLDQPLYTQYFNYIKGFFMGDLGPSLIYQGRSVISIISSGLPVSAILGIEALFLSLGLGIFLGSFAALYKNRWQDRFCMVFSILSISVPSFLLATLLQYIFSIKLSLLPVARWGTFWHTILPVLSLAALPTAFIAKLLRSHMIEVLEQDYIKTAFSKGLSKKQVIFKHALRNSFLPVLSYLGPVSTQILTGSFIVEKIFGIPGLGQALVLSISARDYPVILGLAVFFSFLLLIMVFLTDLLYSVVDPRIKGRSHEF